MRKRGCEGMESCMPENATKNGDIMTQAAHGTRKLIVVRKALLLES
jgi:hypothetical protein